MTIIISCQKTAGHVRGQVQSLLDDLVLYILYILYTLL